MSNRDDDQGVWGTICQEPDPGENLMRSRAAEAAEGENPRDRKADYKETNGNHCRTAAQSFFPVSLRESFGP